MHGGHTTDADRRFRREMRVRDGRRSVILARTLPGRGRPFWVGLAEERFFAAHAWVTGATGSGKTYFLLAALIQVLRRGRHPLVLMDMKGELAELLIETVLPALSTLPGGEKLAGTVRVVRPFGKYVPMLRLTKPEEGVDRGVQAVNLARGLEQALGADLGHRMQRIMLPLAAHAIERGEPLTKLTGWLERPMAFVRSARTSADPAVRSYAATLMSGENRSSVQALLARLDLFTYLDATRQALAAPDCVSFADALRGGVTIVDLGNPPAGAEGLPRFWAGLLVGRLARAIMSRPVSEDTPPALVVLEEAQEILAGGAVEDLERLLAQARFKRVALWLVHQQASQIRMVSPGLLHLLQTNPRLQVTFRGNVNDAKAVVSALPETANARAAQELVRGMCRLPDRHFYLVLRDASFGVQTVRSPRVPLQGLARRAAVVPEEVREAFRRGTVAMDRVAAPVEPPLQSEALDIEDPPPSGPFPRLG